jgi:hypothetical protein
MVFTRKCMIRFDLPENYQPDQESLLRKSCSRLSSSGSSGSRIQDIIDQFQGSIPQVEPVPMAPWKCMSHLVLRPKLDAHHMYAQDQVVIDTTIM